MPSRKHLKHNQPVETLDYKALFTAVNKAAMISLTDKNGDIIYTNPKFTEVSKYTMQELLGQNHRILKSGLMPQKVYKDLWKTISSGQTWRGDLLNKSKTGKLYWVDTTIVPIMGRDKKPEKYLSVRILITHKKIEEQKSQIQQEQLISSLEELELQQKNYKRQILETQKFFLAVENSGEHIIITDAEGIVLYANSAAEKMTGYSSKEMIGTKAGTLWGGLMESSFYRKLWHTIKVEKKLFTGEITNIRKSGQKYIAQATIAPVLNDKNEVKFFIGTERDITIEKDIDKAKTEFVSLASHQLRTPLSAINWFSEMLLNGDVGDLSAAQKEYVEEIYNANQRMVKLINALLNVSRLELGTFSFNSKPFNIARCIKDTVKDLEFICSKHDQTLNVKLEQTLPKITFDPQYFSMIIQNLLSNASKYTPPKGKIALTITRAKSGSKVADFKLPGAGVLISVSDTSNGIPKNQQHKIFSKMFRADNVRDKDTDGTGLGLYILKSIIDQGNGNIWFTSKVKEGTTFYVYLPLKTISRVGAKKLSVE